MKCQLTNDKYQMNGKVQISKIQSLTFDHSDFIWNLVFGICNLRGAL